MNRRHLLSTIFLPLLAVSQSFAAMRGAKYKVKRGSKVSSKDGRAAEIQNVIEFHLTADEPFPVRALDPVLHIGKYEVRDYRYGNMENTLLIFTCAEPDKLEDFAAVFFQYENDTRTRTDLEPFRKGDLP